jgi:hypothetical protein
MLAATTKEAVMKRMMIVARLRDGTTEEAEALLEKGPPFDPEELGLTSHSAYLTSGEVVFVFEASGVEWIVNDIIDDPVVAGAVAQARRRHAPYRSRTVPLDARRGKARRRSRELGGLLREQTV